MQSALLSNKLHTKRLLNALNAIITLLLTGIPQAKHQMVCVRVACRQA